MSRKGILLVDDEPMALKYFSKSFGQRFRVYSANSAQEALEILEKHRDEIGVIVTDQRMPESTGVELLKVVRDRYPRTVRILTTAYSEMDTLVEAINTGAVYSFVSKPWVAEELERTLSNALAHHQSELRDANLLEQTIDELRLKILEDRAADMGQIAAKIGHYVHNALCPLTILIDFLMERGQNAPACSVEFLQGIRAHIDEVARTLKDLERISVPARPSDYELLNLDQILDQALSETAVIREQRKLHIEKDIVKDLPPIKGVASQIQKLFRFMIAEEAVSLPEGSTVNLRVSAHEADREVLGVNIAFEDSVPVPGDVVPTALLHPFNLRGSNPRDFGIFLVSCYFIARHHGGSLNVRNRGEGGLSFSFFLPGDPLESWEHARAWGNF